MNAKGLMLSGLGLALLGGVLTAGMYSNAADNGGTYYVFWGLIAVGVVNFLRGLFKFLNGENE